MKKEIILSKRITKLLTVFLLASACSVQAAKVLVNWQATAGYNPKKNPGVWVDDGKQVNLKGIPTHNWIMFRTSPALKATAGNILQFTFKNVKLKGKIRLGYYSYSSGYSYVGGNDVFQSSVTAPSLTVGVPVKHSKANIVRPRIIMQPGSEFSFTGVDFKITGKADPKYTVIAVPDKANALYKVGETVKFTVNAKEDDKMLKEGQMRVFLYKNGNFLKSYPFDLSKGAAVVEYKMNEPGFIVLCAHVDYKGKAVFKNVWGQQIGAAGFGVEQIKAGKPAPADLLDYWKREYAKLCKEVPADFKKKLFNSNGAHHRYQLTCKNFGGTLTYATITVPKKPGKYPVIFSVPPAGNTIFSYPTNNNAICVTISVFDRTFASQAAYLKFNSPIWYFYKDARKRNTYYYYKSILGMMRVMDYAMKEIPEWDGKHLAAMGRSQGGGSAIIMAALNQKIQCVTADVPALCDHNARALGRRPGWPQLLDNRNTAKSFAFDAQYFDAANFATFVKCPAVVSVGFYDTMCEPASVYAAFNNLKGEKKMINCTRYGHGWGKRDNTFDKEANALVKRTFAK